MERMKEYLILTKKFSLYLPLKDEILKKNRVIHLKDGDFMREHLCGSSSSESEPQSKMKHKKSKVVKRNSNRQFSTSAFANKSRFVNKTMDLSGNGKKCPICFRSFKSRTGYLLHKKSRVEGQCCTCKEKFKSKELLKAHAAHFSAKYMCCCCNRYNRPSKSKIFMNDDFCNKHLAACYSKNKKIKEFITDADDDDAN